MNLDTAKFLLVIRVPGKDPVEKQMSLGMCYEQFKTEIHKVKRTATISVVSVKGDRRRTVISSCGLRDSTRDELTTLHALLIDTKVEGGTH